MPRSVPFRARIAAGVAAGLVAALALSACASDDPAASESASAGASAEADGGDAAVVDSANGVEATGEFGDKPELTIPEGEAPTDLSRSVLSESDGDVVEKGDLLVVNYLGQTWAQKDGKDNVFDNSYDREEPAAFGIGVGGVIPGWDKTLVGQNVGSRVLLTVPPEDGYGDQENGGIPAGSTLVFVVDVVDRFPAGSSASGTDATSVAAGLPKVTDGGEGKPPTIDLAGTTPPKEPQAATLVQGDGDPVAGAKNIAAQVLQVSWPEGEQVSTTWDKAPQPFPVEQLGEQIPPLGALLSKANVGSRLLLTLPENEGQPGTAVVIDVVGTF